MKILAVGDIHGRDCWKTIDTSRYDRIVFIGDYADSFRIPPPQILANLGEIISLKIKFPQKVVLLLGNHDIQYRYYPKYRCSGFNERYQEDYTRIFQTNKELFEVAFQEKEFLFTHAGISNGFASLSLQEYYPAILSKEIVLANLLNEIDQSPNQKMLHAIGPIRGGNAPFGGITWADYRETSIDPLPGYHQIVGHTPMKEIKTMHQDGASITYIDVLETRTEFYTIHDS